MRISDWSSDVCSSDLLLVPESRKGKRGKIGFAIRFHLAPGVEPRLAEDRRGAGLLMPDGSYWQLRLAGGNCGSQAMLEESSWVDGEGRPHTTTQVVIEGITSRSGGRSSWLLKRKLGRAPRREKGCNKV